MTCETCPHYLVLTDLDVERIGAAAKCAPPIRAAAEQESLWRALAAGEIDFVASDHSPAPPSMKKSPDFFAVWGGIAGCQTMLGLLLQHGHFASGHFARANQPLDIDACPPSAIAWRTRDALKRRGCRPGSCRSFANDRARPRRLARPPSLQSLSRAATGGRRAANDRPRHNRLC